MVRLRLVPALYGWATHELQSIHTVGMTASPIHEDMGQDAITCASVADSARFGVSSAGHRTGINVATSSAAIVQLNARKRARLFNNRRICWPSAVQLVVLITPTAQ